MIVSIQRVFRRYASTIGQLTLGEFSCFTLEPPAHFRKGATCCIPAGQYVLALDTEPSLKNIEYHDCFGDRHLGLLTLQDVVGYEKVIIRIGNFPEDTQGSILVGLATEGDAVYESEEAYRLIYDKIAQAILAGDDVLADVLDARH